MKRLKNKAQSVTFANTPTIIMLLVVAILIAGAGGIALNSFRQTECSGHWDGVACYNNASKNFESASTVAYNTSSNGLIALNNVSTQFGVIGTMIGVGLILAVVIGIFVFFQRRK